MRKLILASTSPWRRSLLEGAGVSVEAIAPEVDEGTCLDPDPVARALTLAQWKAEAVAKRVENATVLGADQVLWDGVQAGGKPGNPEEHLAILMSLRGRAHSLYTGFCVLGPNGTREEGVEETRLWMRDDLSEEELLAYVRSGEGSQCAGGYAVEGHGAWLFSRIEGDWYNVIGLPLLRVLSVLRTMGWRYGAGE